MNGVLHFLALGQSSFPDLNLYCRGWEMCAQKFKRRIGRLSTPIMLVNGALMSLFAQRLLNSRSLVRTAIFESTPIERGGSSNCCSVDFSEREAYGHWKNRIRRCFRSPKDKLLCPFGENSRRRNQSIHCRHRIAMWLSH